MHCILDQTPLLGSFTNAGDAGKLEQLYRQWSALAYILLLDKKVD